MAGPWCLRARKWKLKTDSPSRPAPSSSRRIGAAMKSNRRGVNDPHAARRASLPSVSIFSPPNRFTHAERLRGRNKCGSRTQRSAPRPLFGAATKRRAERRSLFHTWYSGDGDIAGVATAGVRTGQPLSSEIIHPACRPRAVKGKATSTLALWASQRRTRRSRRTSACAETSIARTGRSWELPRDAARQHPRGTVGERHRR